MNKIILIGNLTKDWIRDDQSRFIKNTLAVKNGKKTVFIPITSFNEKTMDATENYTAKGSMIAVEGSLDINSTKQQNGSYKTFANVIVNRIEFLQTKPQESTAEPVSNDKYVREDEQKDMGDGILWD